MLPLLFKIGLLPRPPMATSIAPSDVSSSIVIRPDTAHQIKCGRTPVRMISNTVFARPTLSDGKSKELRMDVMVPQLLRERPLVIYVTGGGFSRAPK
jgi:hypothetical protein